MEHSVNANTKGTDANYTKRDDNDERFNDR